MPEQKLRRFIDRLAYGSLILDVCIAFITLSSRLYLPDTEKYLGIVNVALTGIVILSVVSAVMIIGIRFYKNINGTATKNKHKHYRRNDEQVEKGVRRNAVL